MASTKCYPLLLAAALLIVPVLCHSPLARTDSRLRRLARQLRSTPSPGWAPFIHPNANRSIHHLTGRGPKMNSAIELVTVTEPPLLDIARPCASTPNLTLLVLVFTRPAAKQRRQFIRDTYGGAIQRSNDSELYFVVGQVDDASLQSQLQSESTKYGDLLQFRFTDSYFNLTLKAVASLRWTVAHCLSVKFLLKYDDDGFIRLKPFLATLHRLPPDAIYGSLRRSAQAEVLNQPAYFKHTWYIDPLLWPYRHYPDYIGGHYLIPGRFALTLYQAVVSKPITDTVPALPIDDAYVTGVLAQKAAIQRKDFPGYYFIVGPTLSLPLFARCCASLYIVHGFAGLECPLIKLWLDFREDFE